MTQINLKTTFYLVLLSALGAVLPWTLAKATCGALTITFDPPVTTNPVHCTADFPCPSGTQCWSNPPLNVTTASMTCTRVVGSVTRSCTDPASSTSIDYDPPQNSFTSPISFPGFFSSSTPKGDCNCTTITLSNDANKTARATGCKSGTPTDNPPSYPPANSQVFPGPTGSTVNFTGNYVIETPDSPNCPPQPQ